MPKPIDPEEVYKTIEDVCGKIVSERETERETEEKLRYVTEDVFTKVLPGAEDGNLINTAKFILGESADGDLTLNSQCKCSLKFYCCIYFEN